MSGAVEMIMRLPPDSRRNGKYEKVSQTSGGDGYIDTVNSYSDDEEDDVVVELERDSTVDSLPRTLKAPSRGIYFYALGTTISLFIAILMLINTSIKSDGSSSNAFGCVPQGSSEGATTSSPGQSNENANLEPTTTPSPSLRDSTTTTTPAPSSDNTPAPAEPSRTCQAHSHRITNLPGLKGGRLSSCQYAGRLSAGSRRNMFYWLVEASEGYEDKPLVVWFNGGPMCSSLTGLFMEHGPFVVTDDPTSDEGALVKNPHSWHHAANVLYVESPAGVGFSTDSTGQTPSDSNFASSSLAFLETFWQEHPRFANRDVWLSGESYAGHYVTALAALMLTKKSTSAVSARLVGFMLGNGVTDDTWEFDGGSSIRAMYKHDFISDETHASIETNCAASCNPYGSATTFARTCAKCHAAKVKAESESGKTQFLTEYDLYGDKCASSSRRQLVALENHRRRLSSRGEQTPLRVRSDDDINDDTLLSSAPGRHARVLIGGDDVRTCSSATYALSNPCIENMLNVYLRRADVQAAIHASTSKKWYVCEEQNYRYKYEASVLHLYRDSLLPSDLNMLIYSGNVDDSVPTDGTRAWLRQLRTEGKLTHKSGMTWRPWIVDKQVAGFTEVYNEGLTFATVRGAGHMVPATQPKRAFEMVKRFLERGSLP